MLQPEAFSGWTVPALQGGAWPPDVIKESGWAHVMRYPEIRANVLPCLVGNLFEQVFDGQSAVIVDAAPGGQPRGAFVGQPEDVGFAAVAPWVLTSDDPELSLEERRAALQAVGEALLPGSGAKQENGYVAGTVFFDLDLGAERAAVKGTGVPGALGMSRPVSGIDSAVERRPELVVLSTGEVVAAWEASAEPLGGCPRVVVARTTARPGEPIGDALVRFAQLGDARAVRLAAEAETVFAVWQERRGGDDTTAAGAGPGGVPVTGDHDVLYTRSTDGGRTFDPPIPLAGPAGVGTAQLVPAIAAEGDQVHVVWVDGRTGALRIFHAASYDHGQTFGPARAVEPLAGAGAPYNPRQNQWAPAVAVRGARVVVAWTDFRNYSWEIWGTESDDGGQSLAPPVRLDDGGDAVERLHSEPQVAFAPEGDGPAGTWLVAWTDLRVRTPDHDVRVARVENGAPQPSVAVGSGEHAARPQWRPALAVDRERGAVLVAFQGMAPDVNHVFLARSSDGGRTFAPEERLDDAPDDAQQYAPRLAVRPGGGLVVLWEDDRSGQLRVRLAAD